MGYDLLFPRYTNIEGRVVSRRERAQSNTTGNGAGREMKDRRAGARRIWVGALSWKVPVLLLVWLLSCFKLQSAVIAQDSTVIDGALPTELIRDESDTRHAKRQAQMAINWGIYNSRRKDYGDLESESGPGSSMSFTQVTRDYLQDIIERYSVRSIVDVACGDWNWMRHIELQALGVQSYIG